LLFSPLTAPESFVLVSHKNKITRFTLASDSTKNDNLQDATVSIVNTKLIKSLAFDQYDQLIYWIDGRNSAIKRTFLNGSIAEDVIVPVDFEIYDLAIDPYSRILFWTCANMINATRLAREPTPIGAIFRARNVFPRLLTYHYQQK